MSIDSSKDQEAMIKDQFNWPQTDADGPRRLPVRREQAMIWGTACRLFNFIAAEGRQKRWL
jgi:hypothetical protein